MIEAGVKKAVKAFLKEKGAWSYMAVPMGYGRKTVDFHVCYRGRFVAIETKRPTVKNPRPLQRKELYDVRQAGGHAILELSPGLETLRAVFAAIENAPI